MTTRFQLKRGTAEGWLSANPVLAQGEPGIETDTRRQKFGDGVTPWAGLQYSADTNSIDVVDALTSTDPLAALSAKQGKVLADALAAAPGGGSPIQVPFTTSIPLDTAGAGKQMPLTTLSSGSTIVPGAGAVEGGNCSFALVSDGSHTPTFSGFASVNGTFQTTLGQISVCSVIYTYGAALLFITAGGSGIAAAPGQVTGLAAGAVTATSQVLTWSVPSGGAPTDYIVEYKAASSGTWLTFADGVSTATTATVTGLTPSTSYNYRVTASNAIGLGTTSTVLTASTTATLLPPLQVTGLALGTATQSTQPLSWTLPGGGTPSDYIVEFKLHTDSSWTTFADGTNTNLFATVTGLTASTSYDYRVSATNAAGTGAVSATVTGSTVAAIAVPGQVTGLTAGAATDVTQILTWTAPGSGGSPSDYIVEYKVHTDSTFLTFTDGVSTSLTATVTGLTADTSYDYRVTATNVSGNGTASSVVTASTGDPATTAVMRLSKNTQITESGDGTAGWNYVGLDGGGSGGIFVSADLAASTISMAGAGEVIFSISNLIGVSGNDQWGMFYGLDVNGTKNLYSSWAIAFGFEEVTASSNAWNHRSSLLTGGVVAAAANNDLVKITRDSGNLVNTAYSNDGGSTWHALFTGVTPLTGALFFKAHMTSAIKMNAVKQVGMA